MSSFAAARLGPGPLAAALDGLPEGVAIFDADWTICYANPAAAALVGRPASELIARNLWTAVPELAGSIFASFLLHARRVGDRVTWRGFFPPARRWLTVTATVVDDLLQVSARAADQPTQDEAAGDASLAGGGEHHRLRFLAEVSETMIGTLDVEEAIARLAELAVPRLADWAFVTLLGDDGRPGPEAGAHRDPARRGDLDTYLRGRLRMNTEDSPLAAALLTGEPVQLPTIDPALVEPRLPTEEVRQAWQRLAATSGAIVPLRARAETLGALALVNTAERSPHSEAEIATAVEVARRAGLALDNARLYSRQLKVAETLQRSLLTPPPQPDDLQIAVRYEPAASHMHIGGDWYDAFTQPDGATVLVIGDVVGHNVDAAAAMGQIRSILRGIAYERPDSAARTLARVDRVLTGLRIATLATVLIARVDAADPGRADRRTLRWSSAGHLPPLLLDADGGVRQLASAPERLLGTDLPSPRTDHEVVLQPGDTVVFYTDGLVEHGRSGIDEGIARLTGVLASLPQLPPDALCDQLLSRIVAGRTDDDIAILAVRC